MFSWLKRRRRQKLLAQPFPAAWSEHLRRHVAHYAYLSEDEQARLRGIVQVMVAEKNWEGCGGLTIDDPMRVTISGLAGVLLLGIEHDYYSHVLSILVYPDAYAVPAPVSPHTWLVDEEQERLGEAWYRGPVVLSWEDVLWDAQHPGEGQNLVWHEFAHQLDMLDREINGTPPLGTREAARRWHEVMSAEFERLGDDADAGRESLLDPYGASDEAEFFSVATETFFDQPQALRAEHPRLYDLLRTYYRQDPAERMPAPVLHAEPARRRRRKKRT